MARKSNKTAHVLNLLAGHDAKKETQEEAASSENPEVSKNPSENPEATLEVSSPSPSAPSPQNVAVIDKTGDDPLAELIQNKLSDEFEKELSNTVPPTPSAQKSEQAPDLSEPVSQLSPEPEEVAQDSKQDTPAGIMPAAEPPNPEKSDEAPSPALQQDFEELKQDSQVPEQSQAEESAPPAQPEPTPEPDFIVLNIMDRIVREKIIYFLRQFDVCTCDRCVADTVALTLNGLVPKYIVTSPAAADPLLSFYTNKFISDVTVEATKACITIKENPRH